MSHYQAIPSNQSQIPIKYEYRVVPFIGSIKTGVIESEGADKVAQQLQEMINHFASQGWEYYHVSEVDVVINTTMMAGLIGSKGGTVTFNQVIFRRIVNF